MGGQKPKPIKTNIRFTRHPKIFFFNVLLDYVSVLSYDEDKNI